MERGVRTSPIRAYINAGKILNSLTRVETREKINKANISAGSVEYWTLEGASWKFATLKAIDKRANFREAK